MHAAQGEALAIVNETAKRNRITFSRANEDSRADIMLLSGSDRMRIVSPVHWRKSSHRRLDPRLLPTLPPTAGDKVGAPCNKDSNARLQQCSDARLVTVLASPRRLLSANPVTQVIRLATVGYDNALSTVTITQEMEKYAAQRVKEQIDHVLWETWDPIGVNKFSDARDEYSSYVNGGFELLTQGVNDEDLDKHLLCIVNETMGLSAATIPDMYQTVAALRAISLSPDS